MSWNLPTSMNVGGVDYAVNSDYRDILDIISRLTDTDVSERERAFVCLALFYEDYKSIPQSLYEDAAQQMYIFINCGVVDDEMDKRPRPQQIDWEQDQNIIVADVNKIAGTEIRALPYLHWWTFIAYFNAIGEGQLATIVSIREKVRKGKKLEKWEKEFYQNNKHRIDLKPKLSAEDIAEKERLKELLG